MSMKRFALPRNAWLDLGASAALLLVLNLLFARNDPGWVHSQVCPYLLIPVLLGARYGIGPGIVGALIAFLIPAIGQTSLVGTSFGEFLTQRYGLLGWGLVFGIVCGEIRFRARARLLAAMVHNEELEQKLRHAEGEVVELRKAKEELDHLAALHFREQSTLDAGLRWLSAARSQKLARNTLLLLNRQARVTDAALYFFDDKSSLLHRESILGREDHLPPLLDPESVEIVRASLERKEPVTVPELRHLAHSEPQNYLVAIPLISSRSEIFGMLLVTGMPFMAFTPKTLSIIGLICRWAASFIEIKDKTLGRYRLVHGVGDNQKVYSPEFFHHLVGISADAFQKQQTVSTLVLFFVPGAPQAFQDELESLLMRNLRTGDYAAQLDLDIPHLVLLLPLTGEQGADIFEKRMCAAWRHPHRLKTLKVPVQQECDLAVLLSKVRGDAASFYASSSTMIRS